MSKSKAEMTYQIMFESECLLTYQTYQLFMKFPTWAVQVCQENDALALAKQHRGLPVCPLDELPKGAEPEPVELHSITVQADDSDDPDKEADPVEQMPRATGNLRVVSPNQKDDFMHRGPHSVMQHMSLLMYSRFVVRTKKLRPFKQIAGITLSFRRIIAWQKTSFSICAISLCRCSW
jgi:hypothetical protein